MEIFNIHIFEFLLIAGLALVVFGPERLPEVGRFLGQQVAKFLAWQQQSPELQMLNEVRGEFEREIASLRDELVRTRQQLDISSDLSAIKDDLRPMLDLKRDMALPGADAANGTKAPAATPEPTIAPPDRPALVEVVDAAADAAPDAPLTPRPDRLARAEPTSALGTPGPAVGDQAMATALPDEAAAQPDAPDERVEYLRSRRSALHESPEPDSELNGARTSAATAGDETLSEHELLRRLQALAADLQALTGELQARGVIGADWQMSAQPPEQETMPR